MEDGFLRSSGLGSDLLPPLSLVLDKRGIYYDATRPSDLEVLLNHSQLTLAQQMRAEKLRQRLVESKLSKYNLGADFSLPAEAKDKKIILVPGQVEDDASIVFYLKVKQALCRLRATLSYYAQYASALRTLTLFINRTRMYWWGIARAIFRQN
ncbi:hypothetical protein EIMP300_24270 [Escherichia coli]|uniref:Uncharacterized protein n=1 Tax=Escherichia coli TaxID=562 RepID=A0A8S0FL33_ECOLX|nr:hypothetical protein EIMP300_24270 [Escherichia coli]